MSFIKCNVQKLNNASGLALIELVIGVAILGIIMVGLSQVMGTALSVYDETSEKQDVIAEARYAMERMVMFAQQTDTIEIPLINKLKLAERVLDTYDNGSQTYVPGGDGYLDADNDADGVVNEGGADPIEFVTFRLSNGELEEEIPDYSTATTDDTLEWQTLCENVSGVTFALIGTNLVQIEMLVEDGKSGVSLMTRAKAMNVD